MSKWICAKCDGFNLPKHSLHCWTRKKREIFYKIKEIYKILIY